MIAGRHQCIGMQSANVDRMAVDFRFVANLVMTWPLKIQVAAVAARGHRGCFRQWGVLVGELLKLSNACRTIQVWYP